MRKDTPFIDADGWQCNGCGDINVSVVRVGEVMSIGEGDDEGIHPDSDTACLCKGCLTKASSCFEPEPSAATIEAAQEEEREAIGTFLNALAGMCDVEASVIVLDIAEAIRLGRHRLKVGS